MSDHLSVPNLSCLPLTHRSVTYSMPAFNETMSLFRASPSGNGFPGIEVFKATLTPPARDSPPALNGIMHAGPSNTLLSDTDNSAQERRGTNVYVSNLPSTMTASRFRALFASFGIIIGARLVKRRKGDAPVGFVQYTRAGKPIILRNLHLRNLFRYGPSRNKNPRWQAS